MLTCRNSKNVELYKTVNSASLFTLLSSASYSSRLHGCLPSFFIIFPNLYWPHLLTLSCSLATVQEQAISWTLGQGYTLLPYWLFTEVLMVLLLIDNRIMWGHNKEKKNIQLRNTQCCPRIKKKHLFEYKLLKPHYIKAAWNEMLSHYMRIKNQMLL